MLILSRKDGESIKLGDNIIVKVIESSRGVVKLGFEAPDEIMILRSELLLAVEEANKKAVETDAREALSLLSGRLK